MSHRPFEDWLLADEPLTVEQKQALRNHLRTCMECTAIAEVNLALRKAHTAAPAPGFAHRWQARLAAERKRQRRRQAIGLTILSLGGAGLLAWFSTPIALAVAASPAKWIVNWLGYLLFLTTFINAAGKAVGLLMHILSGFIPPYFLAVLLSALAGFSLLVATSLWQITHLSPKARISQAR
ncbi:MAG: hypothetical protein ACUVRJ_03185 [Candidatus Villigracilaceae bacterium]